MLQRDGELLLSTTENVGTRKIRVILWLAKHVPHFEFGFHAKRTLDEAGKKRS